MFFLPRRLKELKQPFDRFAVTRCLFAATLLLLAASRSQAQCTTAIQNNDISIKQAQCPNTVAYLEGTVPTGGNGTYTYQWQANVINCGNGGFSDINGATAKDYAVPSPTGVSICYRRIVTSGAGCTDASNKITVDILNWTSAVAPTVTVTQPTCSTPTGTIAVTSPAPTAGLTYSINGTTYSNTTGTFTGLAPGTYPVTAKMPAGCITPVKSVVINSLPTLTGTISPANSSVCSGSTRLLTATGGTSYKWYLNNALIPGATAGTYGATLAGTYTVQIFDAACSGQASNSATVTVLPLPSGSISPASLTLCPGNNGTLTANGGTSYQWYKDNLPLTGATAANLSINSAGTYSVDIFGSNGCKASASNTVTVTMGTLPSGTVQPTTGVICSGTPVLLTASGGASYQWYRNGQPITVNGTGSTYSATVAGTYTVEISNGSCSAMSSNSAVITTGTNPVGNITPSSAVICPGNSQTLTATGGGTYQWYKDGVPINGATGSTYAAAQAGTYSVVISNGSCSAQASNQATITVDAALSGTISPASAIICAGGSQLLTVTSNGSSFQWYRDNIGITGTAATINATSAGVYTVDIISPNGCKVKASNSSTITVTPLPSGAISPASLSICAGSSGTLTATGGTSYQWYKDGGALSGATASTLSVTQAGTYSVDIFEPGGCRGKSTNECVVTITPLPSAPITPANVVLCPGSSVTLTTGGGTFYQWYKDGILIANATGSTFTATAVGTYTVDIFTGTCKGGASNAGVVTAGTTPTGSITPASATICSGNTVTLTATGGGGTGYQWSLNGTVISGATAATYNASQTGTYSVVIFNNGCSGPATNQVTITPSTAITFSNTLTQPSCISATGSITVNSPTGGSGSGYTYSKDNGASFQTGNQFTNLAAGTYQIVVKDALGCKSNPVSVTINAFVSTLQATAATTSITCTQPTGSVTVSASGGTAPYQYSVDGGASQTSNSFTGLALGSHKATVKDAAGCVFDVNFTITQVNSTLTASATTTNSTCNQANGAVSIQASGGNGGYTYSLDNGTYGSTNTFSNLSQGQHKVSVKDAVGCVFVVNFTISQTANLPNLVVNNPPKICPGASTSLQAQAITFGSDTGLVYSYWSDANTSIAVANPATVSAGTYYIKAANRAGCSVVKPVTVSLFTVTPGNITAPRLSACLGDSIILTASLGSAYQWYRNDTLITGATSVIYQATQAGTYSATIYDGNCVVRTSNSVKLQFLDCAALGESTAFVPTGFTPNKNGANDVLRPIFYYVSALHYFKVYNRWGQQVFETNVLGKGWDGTINGVPQPSDTYSWILEFVNKNGQVSKLSGRSLLIR